MCDEWAPENKDGGPEPQPDRDGTDFDTALLVYLVLDFKAAPTKTKFYVIYDGYLLDQVDRMNKAKKHKGAPVATASKRAPTKFHKELGHNYNHTYTQLERLAEMAETVAALSDISKNKSFLNRILTSHGRKIPGDIFDDITGELLYLRGIAFVSLAGFFLLIRGRCPPNIFRPIWRSSHSASIADALIDQDCYSTSSWRSRVL